MLWPSFPSLQPSRFEEEIFFWVVGRLFDNSVVFIFILTLPFTPAPLPPMSQGSIITLRPILVVPLCNWCYCVGCSVLFSLHSLNGEYLPYYLSHPEKEDNWIICSSLTGEAFQMYALGFKGFIWEFPCGFFSDLWKSLSNPSIANEHYLLRPSFHAVFILTRCLPHH